MTRLGANLAQPKRKEWPSYSRLLDLVEAGGTVAAKIRDRLVAIGEERERVRTQLATQGPLLEAGAAVIQAALDLLDNPQELYRQTTDPVRRQLNQVFFDKLYLDTDEVTDDLLAKPFIDFLFRRSLSRRRIIHTRSHRIGTPNGAPLDAAGGMSAGATLLDRIARGEGLSKATMVDLVHLYSKRETEAARLRLVLTATATPRPREPERHRRQRQHRLSMTEITKLIKKYEQQVPVKELAEQFGIHRTTVTAILQRQRAG